MAQTFIEKHKAGWQRLEELIKRVRQLRGLQQFKREEVRELGSLYRRAAADLAIAREESRDPRLVKYLNSLVIRAHGEIYRTESNGVRGLIDFYRYDFPEIFRQTYRYTLAVFLIFMAMSVFSFVTTYLDDDFTDHAYVSPQLVQHVKENRMWTDSLNDEAPAGAAFIMANNIGVGLLTFAYSIIPVLGTVTKLMPSALQFGAINALIIKYHMVLKLYGFVAGHGVLEFTAIFIAGGAGLMIGMAVLLPGERTRTEALIERGAIAVKLLSGSIPMLIVAGLIEGFISPTHINPYFKFGVSAVTAIAVAAYLCKPARPKSLIEA